MQIKAIERLINSVWTVTADISGNTATIVAYSRDDDDGYRLEHSLPQGRLIEGEGRIVEGLEIDGETYTVNNPQHVFSYR
tara:strand:+ start:466 stop:705 length:240 start_codon:yes stop_codon:yes gene_type:complete